MWDPGQYGRFAHQRGRPFFDLVARIGAGAPASVVDLGCGTGELTATLLDRWPAAAVPGIDSSPGMLAAAVVQAERQSCLAGTCARGGDQEHLPGFGVERLDTLQSPSGLYLFQEKASLLSRRRERCMVLGEYGVEVGIVGPQKLGRHRRVIWKHP